jgi:protein-S-isoprenylcysteine O-methyltransferase Ste14
MLTTILAYLIISLYFVIDHYVRQGDQAKSLSRGQYDRGSTVLIGIAFAISGLGMLASPGLDFEKIGLIPDVWLVGWIGISIMGSGLLLRLWANRTLGAFYTRTFPANASFINRILA